MVLTSKDNRREAELEDAMAGSGARARIGEGVVLPIVGDCEVLDGWVSDEELVEALCVESLAGVERELKSGGWP